MCELTVTLRFLEPFRVIEHHGKKDRNCARFMRGYSYARWHGSDESGRPYITGTLVRSAFLKAVEQILWMNKGKYDDEDCCPGQFKESDAKIVKDLPAKRLRRRQTLTWQNNSDCSEDQYCLHCLFLKRIPAQKKEEGKKPKMYVHFGNFENTLKNVRLTQLAQPRIINRVDQATGKAEDFVKIWEIDSEKCNEFTGKITLSDRADNDKLKALLEDAARLTDKIAGALCQVEIGTANLKGQCQACDAPDEADKTFSGMAEKIAKAFEDADKTVHLRMFADVVRSLRRHDYEKIFDEETAALKMPKGHKKPLKKDHEPHFIWDIEIEKKKIREWLPEQYDPDKTEWRDFCEKLGQALYKASKDAAPEQFSSQRPLGAAEGIHISADPETELQKSAGKNELHEILITGDLVAQTPFFFGWSQGDDKGDHTNMRLLAAKDGKLRLPRSVLRGILRRDLKIVFGTGCRAELGHRSPCSCPVCQIMRQVTLKDSRSEYKNPPRIRHRIRISPPTGTVADGALFDMEVGPTGVRFPFELRMRSEKADIPKELKTVLAWWAEGKVFFSGGAATGKGRFKLDNLKKQGWNLGDKDGFEDYKKTLGGRKENADLSKEECLLEKSAEYFWGMQSLEFSVATPFMTRDPIAALLDDKGNDTVCYKAVETKKDGVTEKEIYLLKGESFRGMLRAAIGRRHNLLTQEHEDCACLLCKIFGNEHEAGKVRVEDLRIESDNGEKHIDRVAIDRFTGGVKDKHKFDMRPLSATPDNALCFSGKIWISNDLSQEEQDSLNVALDDIRNGLYPFGGLGNIGLGWVNYNPVGNSNSAEIKGALKLTDQNFKMPETNVKKIYWPHYFLPFGSAKVSRENKPPTHAYRNKELHTGKLICTLKTKTPLIIPDGENVRTDEKGHKTYNFFNLNGEKCIPGSEIRGMVSSVYETLTNSCMRVFDDKKRLSWRMEADKENQEIFKPGRVVSDGNGGFKIEEMDEVRYPFYDRSYSDINSQVNYFFKYPLTFTQKAFEGIKKDGYINISYSDLEKLEKLIGETYTNENLFKNAVTKKLGAKGQKIFPKILLYAQRNDDKLTFTQKALDGVREKEADIPDIVTDALENMVGKKYKNGKKFISAVKGILFAHVQEKYGSFVKKQGGGCFVNLDILPDLEDAGLPQSMLDGIKRANKWYKNEEKLMKGISKEAGKEITLNIGPRILKHAEEHDKEVPYYDHPTPSDQRILSLVHQNRVCMIYGRKTGYAIIKHRKGAEEKESFMFVATPSANKQGYEQKDVFEIRTGYLKITGANKVEKEKNFTAGLPSVPPDMNRIFHNVMPSLKDMTVRCGENQDRDCIRKRLVPEYLCSEKDKNNLEKGYTYSMTKRCERVFLKKDGNPTFPVDPSAVEKFEILVKEYRKNTEQYKTPDAFRTLLPENGTINKDDLIYFRSEDGKVVEIIPVRISRTVDDKVMGKRLPDDRRPCVREILNETKANSVKQAGLKPLYHHHPDGLCPACALFGTGFYKSRVSFGFAFPTDGDSTLLKDKNGSEYITLPLLERPRPTWSMPRPEQEAGSKKAFDPEVPGRKFYVHHQGWEKVVENSAMQEDKDKKNENNRTVQALKHEQELRFEVRFENLRDWELGLLIYALNLENELAHKLGMAKAFGFGSVDIRVNGIDCNGEDASDLKGFNEKSREKLGEFWGKEKDEDVTESLANLFKLMAYVEDKNVNVCYPVLKKENKDDPEEKPGYEDLKKDDCGFGKKDRKDKLTTPWTPWV